MGHYRITINGHGLHHNGRSDDADKVARDAVTTLKALGHSVSGATITIEPGSPTPATQDLETDAWVGSSSDAPAATGSGDAPRDSDEAPDGLSLDDAVGLGSPEE